MALPDYLESSAKDFARQLTASTSVPINTGTFTGQQFVAGEDPLQTQAINLATSGIGGYQPYLTQAQQLTGPGAGTGAGSIASFMSPYQGAVIDETLRQYDLSRAGGMQDIGQQAYTSGAFGGGRQGALEGQYMADTALGRAGITAQLNQQAFQDATSRRGQALQDQFALSNFQRAGTAGDVASLGNLGAFRQGLNQQQLQAQADAARTAAYEPQQRLQQYGGGLGQLAGFASPAPAPMGGASPFATGLSTATGIAGLFGKLYGQYMKTLNRPMFRYGGPIKEGIMDGMREPLKNGGLSKQFNTGLVGDERYPKTDGREHHFAFLAPLAYQGIMAAGRALAPRAIAAGAKAFGRGLATSPGAGTSVFGRGLTIGQRLKNLLPSGRFRDAGSKIPLGGRNPNNLPVPFGSTMDATGKLSLRQSLTDPRRLGMAIRENPITAFTAAGQIKNIPDIVSGGAGLIADAGLGATNYLLGTDFKRGKKDPTPTGGDTPIERLDKNKTVASGDTGGDPNTSAKTDAEKQKINEDRINENKQKYYKLMGIDKMNKEATYDSLIDASKIIQAEGGDLRGAIKSGTLQSSIINAISKNLDKSADLKRQIDAAVLKGEIQNDVASADTTDKRLKEARIKALDRAEKQSGASGVISQIIAKDGTISGSQTASVLRADGIDYDSVIQDKIFTDFQKDNPTKDEVDFVISKGSAFPDGRFVIGARLVEKKGNEVAFIVQED